MSRFKISVVILLTLLALSCSKELPWEGLIYPKTGQMPYDIAIGHFSTLEECRSSALAILSKIHAENGATPDYECVYKCEISNELPPPGQLATRTCEKTEK